MRVAIALIVLGCCVVAAGVGMFCLPAGIITAGVLAAAGGLLLEVDGKPKQ